jgi:alkylation response protein AidB-like acyl-CoA dehydrogenase
MTEALPDDLETRLGDPYDPANPLSYEAVTAADERGEPLAAGEDLLDGLGLNAEFVPARLGGRLVRADRIALPVRALFRRDPALGLGYGVSSYVAAAPVWTSGSADQQTWLAELLLRGGRAAAAFAEPPFGAGAGVTRDEPTARSNGVGFVVDGRRELVNNVARAEAIVLQARTDDAPGGLAHSHLLVETAALPRDRRTYLPRIRTAGVRGCLLGGVEFDVCPVPDDVVGERGAALEILLRACQTTRVVLPGAVIGALDTQLRTAADFARGRSLYGASIAEFPNVQSTLAGAFVDLLICDSLATVGARALHLLPGETSVLTAAVQYLVPRLLHEASYSLSVTVGARSYLREGRHAIFQKLTRDIPVATLAHASAAACQATIIPQLAGLATRSWGIAEPPPDELFDLGGDLPELAFARPAINARGADSLSALLAVAAADGNLRVAVSGGRLAAELGRLRRRCADLPARDRTVPAGPEARDLAERYVLLLAAAACVGVWRQGSGFTAAPEWLTAALNRLEIRLGLPGATAVPEAAEAAVAAELFARLAGNVTFDLHARRLAG